MQASIVTELARISLELQAKTAAVESSMRAGEIAPDEAMGQVCRSIALAAAEFTYLAAQFNVRLPPA
jgi:hypothetical protein